MLPLELGGFGHPPAKGLVKFFARLSKKISSSLKYLLEAMPLEECELRLKELFYATHKDRSWVPYAELYKKLQPLIVGSVVPSENRSAEPVQKIIDRLVGSELKAYWLSNGPIRVPKRFRCSGRSFLQRLKFESPKGGTPIRTGFEDSWRIFKQRRLQNSECLLILESPEAFQFQYFADQDF
jgi:hypothetical protein